MLEIILPNFDVNEEEATITDILVGEGSFVKKGDVLFKAENTKAIKDIMTPEDGYIRFMCKRFETVKMGAVLANLYKSKEEYDCVEADKADDAKETIPEDINASQKAIRLAEELGVSILEVCKTKPEGIVKTEDVKAFFEKQGASKKTEENKIEVPIMRLRINQYDRERVVIIGAGKGAEIAIDILLDDKDKYVVGLVDSFEKEFLSYSYPLLPCDVFEFPDKIDRHQYDTVILTMGSTLKTMAFRKGLFEMYREKEIKFTNAIANDVNVRRAVKMGVGNVIMHNCYIGTGTTIGDNNMISYGMNLGHHSVLGSHNLIAPGLTTAGCVEIGNQCIIMTGVKTRNVVKIGNNVVLPVGYAVDCDIADGAVVAKA